MHRLKRSHVNPAQLRNIIVAVPRSMRLPDPDAPAHLHFQDKPVLAGPKRPPYG